MNPCVWPLGNGQTFNFEVYDPKAVTWNKVSGLYIFTYIAAVKDGINYWEPLYIGQTNDFSSRIPSHERFNEAIRRGATHIHAVVVAQSADRDTLERLLIQHCKPVMNEQLKGFGLGRLAAQ